MPGTKSPAGTTAAQGLWSRRGRGTARSPSRSALRGPPAPPSKGRQPTLMGRMERGKVLAVGRGIGVIGPKRLLVGRQRPLVERFGVGTALLADVKRGEIAQVSRDLRMGGPQRPFDYACRATPRGHIHPCSDKASPGCSARSRHWDHRDPRLSPRVRAPVAPAGSRFDILAPRIDRGRSWSVRPLRPIARSAGKRTTRRTPRREGGSAASVWSGFEPSVENSNSRQPREAETAPTAGL